jgi:hypothetical protein
VNVAEVARYHPLWQATLPTTSATAPPAPPLPLPSPLKVQPLTFSSDPAEKALPPPPLSISEEHRDRYQQQESEAVRLFEDTLRQQAAQRIEKDIAQRLAKARATEEAKMERQMQDVSQRLRDDLSRWRSQELQKLARETQPRRLRLALPDLPAAARERLEAELQKLETDAETRFKQRQRDIEEEVESQRERLAADVEQRLQELEQSLGEGTKSDVTLAAQRQQVAQDFGLGEEKPIVASKAKNPFPSESLPPPAARLVEEPSAPARTAKVKDTAQQRRDRQQEAHWLRAYLLRDTDRRVRQLAREQRWQLVAESRAVNVEDKTQECVRLLRGGAWQSMTRKS